MRVQILKDFVKQHFTSTQLLDYALDVEKITTSKVSLCPSRQRGKWMCDSHRSTDHWPVVASLTLLAGVCFSTWGVFFLSHCPVCSVVFLANRNPTWSWMWTVSLASPSWTFSGRAAASQGKLSQLETRLEAPKIVRKHWVDFILLYYLLYVSTRCDRTLFFYSSNMKTIVCAISNCDDSHHNVPDCLWLSELLAGTRPTNLWRSEHWTESLSSAVAWASSVSPAHVGPTWLWLSLLTGDVWPCRTLPGPEETEAGPVPPPLGRHLVRAPRAHVHVIPSRVAVHLHVMWLFSTGQAARIHISLKRTSQLLPWENWLGSFWKV